LYLVPLLAHVSTTPRPATSGRSSLDATGFAVSFACFRRRHRKSHASPAASTAPPPSPVPRPIAREGVVKSDVEEALALGVSLAMAEFVAVGSDDTAVEFDIVNEWVISVAMRNGVPEASAVV